MAERKARRDRRGVVEYENLDLAPAYVEGAQGMPTPQGALHVSFYSEFLRTKDKLLSKIVEQENPDGSVTCEITGVPDAFGLDKGDLTIVRRIESSLIMTVPTLRVIVPWLQAKLNELEKQENSDASIEQLG